MLKEQSDGKMMKRKIKEKKRRVNDYYENRWSAGFETIEEDENHQIKREITWRFADRLRCLTTKTLSNANKQSNIISI